MDLRDQVTVIIPATDLDWFNLASDQAVPAAVAAGAAEVYVSLEPTLVEARNAGLRAAQTEWCVFLDADDRLPADYLVDVPDDQLDRTVIMTRIQYFRSKAWRPFGGERWPTVWGHEHLCEPACLLLGNYIHIGAIVSTDAAQEVGGFHDWAWSEDWDLWLRLHLAGATFGRHEAAIYQAWRRPTSRNRSLRPEDQDKIHRDILRSNGLEP